MQKCAVVTSTCEHCATTDLDICRPVAQACRDHLIWGVLPLRLFLSSPCKRVWQQLLGLLCGSPFCPSSSEIAFRACCPSLGCVLPMDSTLVHRGIASCGTYTELRRLRCVSKAWSNVETPYEVLEQSIWETAAGYEMKFRSSVWQRVVE